MAEKDVLKNLTFVGATAADCCYPTGRPTSLRRARRRTRRNTSRRKTLPRQNSEAFELRIPICAKARGGAVYVRDTQQTEWYKVVIDPSMWAESN